MKKEDEHFLALCGQLCKVVPNEKSFEIGKLGEKDALFEFIEKEEWNECHLIVRGNTPIHLVNGRLMSVMVDDNVESRKMEGLLGVQVHVGPPMKIEYKNIRIKAY